MKPPATLLIALAAMSPLYGWCSSRSEPSTTPLPTCATTCLDGSEPDKNACNPAERSSMNVCFQTSCTAKENLLALRYFAETCHDERCNTASRLMAVTWVFTALATVSTSARLYSRRKVRHDMNLGDHLVWVTCVVIISMAAVLEITTSRFGLGQDVWFLTPDQITSIFIVFFGITSVYHVCMAMVKVIVVSLYTRIFPGRRLRLLVRATQTACVAAAVALILLNSFQCSPVDHFWTAWTGESEGTCINVSNAPYAITATNIALDIWVMLLPLPEILKLQLSWGKRAQIMAMFSLGIFVTAMSALRLTSVTQFWKRRNPSCNFVNIIMYSMLEITVGTICACLPEVRLLLARVIPSLRSSAAYSGSGNGDLPTIRSNRWVEGGKQPRAVKESRQPEIEGSTSAVELVLQSRRSSWEFHLGEQDSSVSRQSR